MTTSRLFKETALLQLSLTNENFVMFLEYYTVLLCLFCSVRQYITNMVILVYALTLIFVWT